MHTRREVFDTLNAMRSVDDDRTDEFEIMDWLDANHFRRVGTGGFKSVFKQDGSDFVVKVSHNGHGAGDHEVDNILDAPTEIMAFILPVWQGNGFQIQDAVTMRFCPDPDECGRLLSCMHDSASSWRDVTLPHNHTHDADGTLQIYDYGQSVQWESQLHDPTFWREESA